nr:MAG TPA: hypothetical protein [Caudoviricetes sp.]
MPSFRARIGHNFLFIQGKRKGKREDHCKRPIHSIAFFPCPNRAQFFIYFRRLAGI